MDRKLNNFLKDSFRRKGSEIVGRLLGQIDILSKHSELSEEQKLKLIKEFNRELIYEEMRNLRNTVIFGIEGREYKSFPIYSPTRDYKKS